MPEAGFNKEKHENNTHGSAYVAFKGPHLLTFPYETIKNCQTFPL